MKCLPDGYGCEDVERQGFVSLMDLYENNFIRMRKLAPDLATSSGAAVSRVAGCQDLHLHILESSHFTTTFLLTYYFFESRPSSNRVLQKTLVAEPLLKCRAYHDASQVEVLTGHLHHGRQKLDKLSDHPAREKWKLNRLLYKWLGYSLYQGHVFEQFDGTANLPKACLSGQR